MRKVFLEIHSDIARFLGRTRRVFEGFVMSGFFSARQHVTEGDSRKSCNPPFAYSVYDMIHALLSEVIAAPVFVRPARTV